MDYGTVDYQSDISYTPLISVYDYIYSRPKIKILYWLKNDLLNLSENAFSPRNLGTPGNGPKGKVKKPTHWWVDQGVERGWFLSCWMIVCISTLLDQITRYISLKNPIYLDVWISPSIERNFKFISIFLIPPWRVEFLMAHQNNSFGANFIVPGLGDSLILLLGIYSSGFGFILPSKFIR